MPRASAASLHRTTTLLVLLALALAAAGEAPAQQRRDPARRMGRTVLDETGLPYRFDSFVVGEGERRWRMWVGIPQGQPPADGFPSFWMLDGNGALMEFDRALLEDLAAQPAPPVLVFVGYDKDQRIDTPARTRDYTFMAWDSNGPGDGVETVGGGADAFLDVIVQRVLPQVEQRAPLDSRVRSIWGHSFGGLFALNALYRHCDIFHAYAPASPSLWWGAGALLEEPETRFVAAGPCDARVLLMLGGAERVPDHAGRDLSDPRVQAHLRRVGGVASDATVQLSRRLAEIPGLEVEYREFPGLGHGPMFRASLMYALHRLHGVTDRSAAPRHESAP